MDHGQDDLLQRYADELAKMSSYFDSIIETMGNMLIITDAHLVIKKVNQLTCKTLGYTEAELFKKSISLLLEDNRTNAAFLRRIRKQPIKDLHKKYLTKNGRLLHVLLSTSILQDSGDIICVAQDITALQKSEEKLRHLARYDNVTGLPNRLLFKETLAREMARCERSGQPFALLLFDIDYFKSINDRFGHLVGDDLLRKFANKLRAVIRTEDFIARLAGDEFVIILTSKTNVEEAAERLVHSIARKPFRLNDQNVPLTISIGVAVFPKNGRTPSDLIRNSDIALYQAKRQGRNQYQVFRLSRRPLKE